MRNVSSLPVFAVLERQCTASRMHKVQLSGACASLRFFNKPPASFDRMLAIAIQTRCSAGS